MLRRQRICQTALARQTEGSFEDGSSAAVDQQYALAGLHHYDDENAGDEALSNGKRCAGDERGCSWFPSSQQRDT